MLEKCHLSVNFVIIIQINLLESFFEKLMQPILIFVGLMKKLIEMNSITTRLLAVLFVLTTVFIGNSQLVLNPNGPITPAQAVQDILIGAGIQAFNITFNGSAPNALTPTNSVREFNAGATAFPIQSGVLMQTQGAPTVFNDADLEALAGQPVTNGVIIEFDFIPQGDTLSFNYIFASAEYTFYTCSNFNDVFGFFISGPGITGPYSSNSVNIATVPGGTIPVGINTVNGGAPTGGGSAFNCSSQDPNWQANAVYFTTTYNPIFTTTNGVANFNGATITLAANSSLVCNQTYHIKLAIANAVDQALDSGVFLEANSFSSEAIEVAVATVTGDDLVYEGCTSANFLFIRPQNQVDEELIINYTIGGTATQGVDYNDLPNPVVFPIGVDTVVLTLNPFQDGISDNNETVIITAIVISACGDTLISQGTLYIIDEIPITITETDLTVPCADDSVLVSAIATGLFPPFTYSWQGGQTGTTAYYPTVQGVLTGSVDYIVTATNSCGYSNTDTVTITLNQTLQIASVHSEPASCDPIGLVYALLPETNPNGVTGVPLWTWTGPGPNSTNFINQSVWTDLSSGWYYISLLDSVCQVFDSVFVDILPPPIASFMANPNSGCSPLEVLFNNNSQNASSYEWNFGNGNTASVGNTSPQVQVYTESTVVQLIAIEGNCSDTVYTNVVIAICGCMDPLATNYNPQANFDDGSCLYPSPTVIAPNVFTPNGDGSNETWFLNTTNSTNVSITILNRWGNVIFESSGLNPSWNGETQGGTEAADGVYFYKYRVEGYPNSLGETQALEGHGFVHLVR